MKHTMIVVAALLVLAPAPAFADVPGRGWIGREKASAGLAKRGYNVTKIKPTMGIGKVKLLERASATSSMLAPKPARSPSWSVIAIK